MLRKSLSLFTLLHWSLFKTPEPLDLISNNNFFICFKHDPENKYMTYYSGVMHHSSSIDKESLILHSVALDFQSSPFQKFDEAEELEGFGEREIHHHKNPFLSSSYLSIKASPGSFFLSIEMKEVENPKRKNFAFELNISKAGKVTSMFLKDGPVSKDDLQPFKESSEDSSHADSGNEDSKKKQEEGLNIPEFTQKCEHGLSAYEFIERISLIIKSLPKEKVGTIIINDNNIAFAFEIILRKDGNNKRILSFLKLLKSLGEDRKNSAEEKRSAEEPVNVFRSVIDDLKLARYRKNSWWRVIGVLLVVLVSGLVLIRQMNFFKKNMV